mmetsp:Transcript_39176/g.63534  ORF Transcript_39176/g.63534 Transcript_39176/m.63534 type:complete len:460 (-) Transcript_39176:3673-5052(-)
MHSLGVDVSSLGNGSNEGYGLPRRRSDRTDKPRKRVDAKGVRMVRSVASSPTPSGDQDDRHFKKEKKSKREKKNKHDRKRDKEKKSSRSTRRGNTSRYREEGYSVEDGTEAHKREIVISKSVTGSESEYSYGSQTLNNEHVDPPLGNNKMETFGKDNTSVRLNMLDLDSLDSAKLCDMIRELEIMQNDERSFFEDQIDCVMSEFAKCSIQKAQLEQEILELRSTRGLGEMGQEQGNNKHIEGWLQLGISSNENTQVEKQTMWVEFSRSLLTACEQASNSRCPVSVMLIDDKIQVHTSFRVGPGGECLTIQRLNSRWDISVTETQGFPISLHELARHITERVSTDDPQIDLLGKSLAHHSHLLTLYKQLPDNPETNEFADAAIEYSSIFSMSLAHNIQSTRRNLVETQLLLGRIGKLEKSLEACEKDKAQMKAYTTEQVRKLTQEYKAEVAQISQELLNR